MTTQPDRSNKTMLGLLALLGVALALYAWYRYM
jgi:hypothetical protein